MKLRSWLYSLRDAFRSVRLNGLMSVASTGAVAISLLVLSLFLLLALNMDHAASVLEAEVEIVARISNDIDDPTLLTRLQERLQRIPGVGDVRFVTREELFERVKNQWGMNANLLEGADPSEIRNAFEVRVPDKSQIKTVAMAIGTEPGIDEVDFHEDLVTKLFALTGALRSAGLGLALILCGATVFMIGNTIRLTVFARRREISIMKMVGATDTFIRRPFLLEGALLGILGALVASLVIYAVYSRLFAWILISLPWLPFLPPQPLLQNLVLALIALGALLGFSGSGIAVRRFLKV